MTPRSIAHMWRRFWFTPQPTSSLALFRIGMGLVTLLWALALCPSLKVFFSRHGIEPVPVDVSWGLLGHFSSDAALFITYAALVTSAIGVLVGFHTRVASVVMFVTIFAFIERTPSIFNSGDGLLRNLSFFLMLMPSGDAISLDRRRVARGHFWAFPERSPWALRLVQIQVSILYASAVYHKLDGGGWTNGTAMSYVWRMDDIARFTVPSFVVKSLTIGTLVSLLTLAIEFLLATLIWVRTARPLVLALGVMFHVGIDLTLRIGFFSVAILVAYLAFTSPETATKAILRVRDVLDRQPHPRSSAQSNVSDSVVEVSANQEIPQA